MKPVVGAILMLSFFSVEAMAQMTFLEDQKAGTVTIKEAGALVLTYCHGDQLKEGVDPKYTQSGYVHPLFGLDGRVLTDDFPADHLHHHGLFWAWPLVKTRNVITGNWDPRIPSLRRQLVRWTERRASRRVAELGIENAWILDGKEKVALENVVIRAWRAESSQRRIDVQIVLEAVGGPLELQGAPDQNKGYGGLCFRGAPLFTGATMTTDQGALKSDVVNKPFRWAELTAEGAGLRIEVLPEHPGQPVHWLIRNSYAGILNPSWPGLRPAILRPGEPIRLTYLIQVLRGS